MIAVTGGAGFIGSELVALLRADGENVCILDKEKSKRFPELSNRVDVRDINQLTDALRGCDKIYHLAAEHRDNVTPARLYYDVNVNGTKNVVKAAEVCGIKTIVFASSVALYGLGQEESNETSGLLPFNDYGKSKLQAEEILRHWATRDPTYRLVIIRLAATFGPGSSGNLHRMIKEIANDRFV